MEKFKKWTRKKGSIHLMIGCFMVMLVVIYTLCSYMYPTSTINQMNLIDTMSEPGIVGGNMKYPLGTDNLGRDIMLRTMAGGRISLVIAGLAVIGTAVLGSVLGVVTGYYGGFIDNFIGVMAEIKLTLPMMLLMVLFLSVLGPSILTMTFVLAINEWVTIYRNVRASTMVEKNKDYVLSAKTMGASDARIIFRYILPNVLPSIIVLSTLLIASVVLSEASLSYLGVGLERPSASWGRMINDGQEYVQKAWWISSFPALIIAFLVIGVNLIGDGLRKLTKME
jgi:peptide/nickel transport system permease protein